MQNYRAICGALESFQPIAKYEIMRLKDARCEVILYHDSDDDTF